MGRLYKSDVKYLICTRLVHKYVCYGKKQKEGILDHIKRIECTYTLTQHSSKINDRCDTIRFKHMCKCMCIVILCIFQVVIFVLIRDW